ncbi:CsbD family protein [Mesorhizobium muleiense]
MVNKSQIAGLAKQLKGSVKKAAGKATGNRRVQAEGVAEGDLTPALLFR